MKALVIDDDRVLADVVAFTLRREGFVVIQAYDGVAGLERWEAEEPDVIILDVNMPKLDGFEVCRRIRERTETPILLLTVRDDENDIVKGLDIGADDYIIKPFSPRQLVARTKAILRRSKGTNLPVTDIRVGDLWLVPYKRELSIDSEEEIITLTPLECRLLKYFLVNAGQVSTFEMIIENVWGAGGADRDMVRQLIRRLRIKIESDPKNPTRIQSVPGLGYGLII